MLKVRRALVRAEHQAVPFLADIAVDRFVAQHRHFRESPIFAFTNLGYGFGHPVLVQDRKTGQFHAQHSCGLLDIVSRRRDHVLTDNVALVGADFPLAGGEYVNGIDLGVEINVGAELFCSLGEGLGDIGRCNVTVIRVINSSQQVGAALHQRPEINSLFRVEDFGPDPLRLGNRGVIEVLIHTVGGFGNP